MLETAPRSRIAITLSVWNALLLREALSRLFGRRAAWFWLLTEPVFHIAYLMFLFAVVRVRHVGGIYTPLWIMLGLLGYFMFQRPRRQAAGAISANRPLFAYRQVLPVDTVIRCAGRPDAVAGLADNDLQYESSPLSRRQRHGEFDHRTVSGQQPDLCEGASRSQAGLPGKSTHPARQAAGSLGLLWMHGSTWRICSGCRRGRHTSSAMPAAW